MVAFASTRERVPANTAGDVNEQIRQETEDRIRYFSEHTDEIDAYLAELDREWDIERTIEANAAHWSLARIAPVERNILRLAAYELLFRDGTDNFFKAIDSDAASRSTLDSSWLMGFDILCSGALAFINCTREALLRGYSTLLPPALHGG